MTLLGILKLLGVVALLAPGFARLKEWAYAGFSFDLIGAAFSFAAAGDPTPAGIAPPLLILAVVAVSYVPATRVAAALTTVSALASTPSSR